MKYYIEINDNRIGRIFSVRPAVTPTVEFTGNLDELLSEYHTTGTLTSQIREKHNLHHDGEQVVSEEGNNE